MRETVKAFKALSDETRIKILKIFLERSAASVRLCRHWIDHSPVPHAI